LTIVEWNQEMLGKGFEIVGDDGDRVLFEFTSPSEGRIIELIGEYAGEVRNFSYVYERDNDEIAYLLMTCEEGMDDDFPGITIQESVDYRLEFFQSGMMRWTEENGQAVNVDSDVIVWTDDSPGSGDFHIVEYPVQFLANAGIEVGGPVYPPPPSGGGYAPSLDEWNGQMVGLGYEISLMEIFPGDGFSPEEEVEIKFLSHFETADTATEYAVTDDPQMPESEKVRGLTYQYEQLSDSVGQLTIQRLDEHVDVWDEGSNSMVNRTVRITEKIGLYYSGEHEGRHAPLYFREVDDETNELIFEEELGPHNYEEIPVSDRFRLIENVQAYRDEHGL